MLQQHIIDDLRAFSDGTQEVELQMKINDTRSFYRVQKYLSSYLQKTTKQIDYISPIDNLTQSGVYRDVIRKSVVIPSNPEDPLDIKWIQKTKKYFIDVPEYLFKIVISEEIDVNEKKKFKYVIQRNKDRWTYAVGPFTIDITKTIQIQNGNSSEYNFELEIEFPRDLSDETFQTFEKIFLPLWCVVHDTVEPYANFEKLFVQNQIKDLTINIRPRYLHPSDLTWELAQKSYRASLKVDGTRKWLVVNQIGIWLILPFVNEYSLIQRIDTNTITPFVLDGELTSDGVYHVFDLLSLEGIDQREIEHTVRMQRAQNTISDLEFDLKITIKTLSFVTLTYDTIFDTFSIYTNKNLSPEGMVIVPNRTDLYPSLKWKHPDRHSIDVRVVRVGKDFELFGRNSETEEDVKINTDMKVIDKLGLLQELSVYDIIELLLTPEGLEAFRIRKDKVVPNSIETIQSAFELYKTPMTSDDLSGRSMFYIDLFRDHLVNQIVDGHLLKSYKDKIQSDIVVLTDQFKNIFDLQKIKKTIGDKDLCVIIIDRDRLQQYLDPMFYGLVLKEIDFDLKEAGTSERIKIDKKSLELFVSMSDFIDEFGMPTGRMFQTPPVILSTIQKVFVQMFSVAYFRRSIDSLSESEIMINPMKT